MFPRGKFRGFRGARTRQRLLDATAFNLNGLIIALYHSSSSAQPIVATQRPSYPSQRGLRCPTFPFLSGSIYDARRGPHITMVTFPLHFKNAAGFPFIYKEHCDEGVKRVRQLLRKLMPLIDNGRAAVPKGRPQ